MKFKHEGRVLGRPGPSSVTDSVDAPNAEVSEC
jgi:hypothetical protein